MPLVLWPVVGTWTPLASIFVCWAMLGTEDIGVQVEEPFDVLPLFQYTQGIAATCDGMAKDAKAEQITLSLDLDVERTGPQILANGYDEKAVVKLMEDQLRKMIREIKKGRFDKPGGILNDNTLLSDESLDQVILNYLATNKKEGE